MDPRDFIKASAMSAATLAATRIRRSRGESVTLIDTGTRRTRSTAFAQHFLQFRPHTSKAKTSTSRRGAECSSTTRPRTTIGP